MTNSYTEFMGYHPSDIEGKELLKSQQYQEFVNYAANELAEDNSYSDKAGLSSKTSNLSASDAYALSQKIRGENLELYDIHKMLGNPSLDFTKSDLQDTKRKSLQEFKNEYT